MTTNDWMPIWQEYPDGSMKLINTPPRFEKPEDITPSFSKELADAIRAIESIGDLKEESLPACIDPEVWDAQSIRYWMDERLDNAGYSLPKRHMDPLTRFEVGDWVRVSADSENNVNTNDEMAERYGEWLQVREVHDDTGTEDPGLRLTLQERNGDEARWAWYWYHLDQKAPFPFNPLLSHPDLPKI